MAQRKIRKAKRPSQRSESASEPASAAPKANPFANVQLVAPPASAPAAGGFSFGAAAPSAAPATSPFSFGAPARKTGKQNAKRTALLKMLAALPEHLRLGVTLPGMRELLEQLPSDAF